MRRFTIAPDAIVDGRVTFDASQSRHLARVLRLRAGDTVVATDGEGHDYTVRLDVLAARVTGTVVTESAGSAESPLTITLVQGIPKADKMDAIVRAATELGVAHVRPALTARTVVRLAASAAVERAARWQRVAREASKQCGRAVVPVVAPPAPLSTCLEAARTTDLALCLWEGGGPPLATAWPDTPVRRAAVLIGPEGGLEASEVEAARGAGWRVVNLGARVLRTETAGPAIIAILQARFGDLGGDGGR
jgi:16S rRNA (uracil1498-N3)-methyltransferase